MFDKSKVAEVREVLLDRQLTCYDITQVATQSNKKNLMGLQSMLNEWQGSTVVRMCKAAAQSNHPS